MNAQSLEMFDSTIKYGDGEIFVKPLCDYFGIQYDNQLRRIKTDPILKTSAGKFTSMLLFGDERPRVTLTPYGFLRWIQLLNPQVVQADKRDLLLEYQTLIFDRLFGSLQSRRDIEVANMRLNKLSRLYSKIGNEIQSLQHQLKDYVHGQLRLDMYTPQKLK